MRTNRTVPRACTHDVSDVGADVDHRLVALFLEVHAHTGRADRAHHRERHEVETDGFELRAVTAETTVSTICRWAATSSIRSILRSSCSNSPIGS